MKKLFLIAAIFLFASTIKSQVATAARQDTSNAKLNAIRLQTISNKSVNVIGTSTVQQAAGTTFTVAAHGITSLPSGTAALATNALQTTIDANITGLRADELTYQQLRNGMDPLAGGWEMSSVTFTANALASAKFLCELAANTSGRDVIIRKIRISGTQTTPGVAFVDFVQDGSIGAATFSTVTGHSWQNNQAGTAASEFVVNILTSNPATALYTFDKVLTRVPVYLSPEFRETVIDFTTLTNNMIPTFSPGNGLRGPALGGGSGTNCYLGLNAVTYTGGFFLVTIDYAERDQL